LEDNWLILRLLDETIDIVCISFEMQKAELLSLDYKKILL